LPFITTNLLHRADSLDRSLSPSNEALRTFSPRQEAPLIYRVACPALLPFFSMKMIDPPNVSESRNVKVTQPFPDYEAQRTLRFLPGGRSSGFPFINPPCLAYFSKPLPSHGGRPWPLYFSPMTGYLIPKLRQTSLLCQRPRFALLPLASFSGVFLYRIAIHSVN